MSPGCATRLVCEDGTRAFVKAVGAELNPMTPEPVPPRGHGADADRIARAVGGPARVVRRRRLGRDPARGRRGHPPRPRRRRHHGPAAPRDRPAGRGARRAGARPARARPGERRAGRPAGRLPRLGRRRRPGRRGPAGPAPRLDPARHRDLGAARPLRSRATTCGLVHCDIRNDNLLERPTGELVFLDWGGTGDRARCGWTRCSPGWSGSSRPGSTPRSPPPRRWPRPATRPSTPGWSGSRRSSPGARTPPSTSTCRRSTISGSRESRRMLVGAERRLGMLLA